jgi:hypothetical protein
MPEDRSPQAGHHAHGPGCGHMGIRHDGHVDYVQDGRLHYQRPDGSIEEHEITVTERNPDGCNPVAGGGGHEAAHVHGPGCGHEEVPHAGHACYVVEGRLHHPHGDHCDDHGPVDVVQRPFSG